MWEVDTTSIEILNKPNQELSTKIIAEVDAGILPIEKALEILYPEIAEEVAIERAIQDALQDPRVMNANAEAQGNSVQVELETIPSEINASERALAPSTEMEQAVIEPSSESMASASDMAEVSIGMSNIKFIGIAPRFPDAFSELLKVSQHEQLSKKIAP